MKILFLCHRMPYPPKRGGKIRPFNMIRHLGRSHEVTVATLARTAQEQADGEELRRYCDELHVGRLSGFGAWARFGLFGFTGRPATFGYFYSPTLYRTVRRLLATRGFDAGFVHSPRERDVLTGYVRTPISVIPNGVDLEYFQPGRSSSQRYVPNRIVFTGNMSYRPNVDAVAHFAANIL